MSSEIDDRVVVIKFDNADFERRIATTLKSLDELQKSLDFANASKGFDNVAAAAAGLNFSNIDEAIQNTSGHFAEMGVSGSDSIDGVAGKGAEFDLSAMGEAIDTIGSKFSAMGVVGFSIIDNLTDSALNFASNMAGKILDPIISGGKTRAGNIEQAQFQFRGLGIDVDKAMSSALDAVRGTAFGLDEAAKTAAQFGASGIKAGDQMTAALRGVAGAAAMTGSSFSEISGIFTSSAGTGVVNNQDLIQFGTRGLNAAAAIAPILHKTEQQIHEMAANGELDFKTFADAMDKAFGKHATEANQTYSGSLANMHAALSRLGASFFGPKMEQQRDLFNTLSPVIDNVAWSLKPLIQAFIDIGKVGNDVLIAFLKNLDFGPFIEFVKIMNEGVRAGFNRLVELINPLREAFREIFPKSSVSILVLIAETFRNLMFHIQMGTETLDQVKRIFAGLFAVVEIGWTIIKNLFLVIKNLFTALDGGAQNVGALEFFASLADKLVRLNEILVAGGGIQHFFERIGGWIQGALDKIREFEAGIVNFFTSFGGNAAEKAASTFEASTGRVQDRIDSIRGVIDKLRAAVDKIKDIFESLRAKAEPIIDKIMGIFDKFKGSFSSSLSSGDFRTIVDAFNAGGLAYLALTLRKFMKNGLSLDFTGGVLDSVKGFVNNLDGSLGRLHQLMEVLKNEMIDTMKALQTKLKAEALVKIATAIGILAASLLVLSLIDSLALTQALGAMGAAFVELGVMLKVMDKMTSGGLKISGTALALELLAGAMLLLSFAIKNLSTLSWQELITGLAGTAVGLAMLSGVTQLITADTEGLITAGIAMGVIATAMLILGEAFQTMGGLSWTELAKGLLGMGISLAVLIKTFEAMSKDTGNVIKATLTVMGIATAVLMLGKAVEKFSGMSWGQMAQGMVGIALAMKVISSAASEMPKSMILTGPAMVAIGYGLGIIADAVIKLGAMSWEDMAKGLLGITTALIVIAGTISEMPPTTLLIGLGLIKMAVGLAAIAAAVSVMGGMDMGTLAKGIGGIAAMLLILVVGVNAMSGAALGALSMIVVAGALAILGKVIKTLGSMDLKTLAIGLGAIAATFAVLGLAALLLTPVIPSLLGLALALEMMGKAFLWFGIGAAATAGAFMMLAKVGTTGIDAILAVMKKVIGAIPGLAAAFVESLAKAASDMVGSFGEVLDAAALLIIKVLDVVIKVIPKLVEAISKIIDGVLILMVAKAPMMIFVGYQLLTAFLQGMLEHISDITTTAADIIISFIDAIAQKTPDIVDAAINLLFSFLSAIGYHAEDITGAGLNLLVQFLLGIYNNIMRVENLVVDIVYHFLVGLGQQALLISRAGADLILTLIGGIASNLMRIVRGATDVAIAFIAGLAANAIHFANAAADVLVAFLNGLADAIRTHAREINDAGVNLADAIISGLTGGLIDVQKIKKVVEAAKNLAHNVVEGFKSVIPFASPSPLFIAIGGYIGEGTAIGLDRNKSAGRSARALAERVVENFNDVITHIPDTLGEIKEFQPTIRPVLDLTDVERGARDLGPMLAADISPDASFRAANLLATATADRASAAAADDASQQPREVQYIQNIYSPKAVSVGDVYRGTKSQLALKKEELNI